MTCAINCTGLWHTGITWLRFLHSCRLSSLAQPTLKYLSDNTKMFIVQELCESRGGRPGLSVLTSLLVSVDVKLS